MPTSDESRSVDAAAAPSAIDGAGASHSGPRAAPDAALAREYLLHLLQRDLDSAARVVLEAGREGRDLRDLCEHVLLRAVVEADRMWRRGEASIGDEHYCSAATLMVMAQLFARMPEARPSGRRVLVASTGRTVPDALARMLEHLLAAEGWDVDLVSGPRLVEAVFAWLEDEAGSIDVVAVVTDADSLPAASRLAEALRSRQAGSRAGQRRVPVLGYVHASDAGAASPTLSSADAVASDARSALQLADRLTSRNDDQPGPSDR